MGIFVSPLSPEGQRGGSSGVVLVAVQHDTPFPTQETRDYCGLFYVMAAVLFLNGPDIYSVVHQNPVTEIHVSNKYILKIH